MGAGARIVQESDLNEGTVRDLLTLASREGSSELEQMRTALAEAAQEDAAGLILDLLGEVARERS